MPKKYQQRSLQIKPQSSSSPSLSLSRSSRPQHESSSQRSVNDLIRESRRLQLKKNPHTPPSSNNAAAIHPSVRTSGLPDGAFPPPGSLQDLVLKTLASDWEWHAESDLNYFNYLPVRLRETLLSYIAVYGDNVQTDPLKVLLLLETDSEERDEVRRLDLSNALGYWTTFKQLERDLLVKNAVTAHKDSTIQFPATEPTPENWDTDSDGDEFPSTPTISPMPKTIHNFANLKHLSLAISPSNVKAASWSSLLSLATELRTLTSLSLAYWPQPTFTPNAASTRAVVPVPGFGSITYGGSDVYTSHDNNWREAAGILRTLSRSLYCLKWLDLTGCGNWFAALQWIPSPSSSPSSSPNTGSLSAHGSDILGPEWNGGWRGLEKLVLEVGWKPGNPLPGQDDHLLDSPTSWDVENERRLYRYQKDRERFAEIRRTAQSVAHHLRAIRKQAGGKWIDVEFGEDLVPYMRPPGWSATMMMARANGWE